MSIYLDNAATTPLDERVFEEMKPFFLEHYGNPSSIHSHGRYTRTAIENARKRVAQLLGATPSEIFFTSGGTEADNMGICGAVKAFGIKNIITAKTEHHAVLNTIENLVAQGTVAMKYVNLDNTGHVDMEHLEDMTCNYDHAMVCLMHGNNEIGNINNIKAIGDLCDEYELPFFSDTVQTVGHYPINLDQLNVQYITGSAHKFHGPKGVGFIYTKHTHLIPPLLMGGGQERNMRGGTENVAGIVGLAKALELAYENLEEDRKNIESLKRLCIELLKSRIPDVEFNGDSASLTGSLYTVLNVSLPSIEDNDMLVFNLDINKISASAGSACSSGTQIGSHVLEAISPKNERGYIRLSFSKYNTEEEIMKVVDVLANICGSDR